MMLIVKMGLLERTTRVRVELERNYTRLLIACRYAVNMESPIPANDDLDTAE